MTNFTIRIELHGASGADYDKLHSAMIAGGFSRRIKGDNGIVYHLPTAEYRYSTLSESATTVRDRAATIARSVIASPEPATLVTQGEAAAWSGLFVV